ncbi:MAG: hypothetical protein KatS3mg023_3707 [Armatimonadota bacterium]|nr:MAG: hypothetical protein KatS3mg023_3707 [Armatimonadota bacterium]
MLVPVLNTTVTDSLLIIGTALDGPTNTPVVLSDLSTAISTFGPMVFEREYLNPGTGLADGVRSNNDLVEAIERALAAGCNNIVAVRVPGERASANISTTGGSPTNVLIMRGLFDGDVYNNVVLTLTSGSPNHSWQLQQPAERGGTISGTLPASATLGDLVNAVNGHASNGTVRLAVHPSQTNPSAVLAQPLTDVLDSSPRNFTTSGGAAGTRDQRFSAANGYKAILDLLTAPNTGTFALLSEADADVVYLSCLYADDRVGTAATDGVIVPFAKFVHELSAQRSCHGVLGARPYVAPDMASLASYYQTAYLDNTSGVVDAATGRIKIGYFLAKHPDMVKEVDGVEIDFGRYLSIVIGMPCQFRSWQLGDYVENAAASFAGMLTTLSPAEISAFRTPRGVRDVVGARIPKATFEALMAGVPTADGGNGGSYVVIRPPMVPGATPVVANDITAAQSTSVFHYQSNVRIANAASKYLRLALIPFLGRPNTQETLTAMATAVRGVLNRLVEIGALLGGEGIGYRFSLEPTAIGMQTIEVRCVAELRPASFIRAITVDLTVTL